MDIFCVFSAVVIVANILYAMTAILQKKDDPRFMGAKLIYRS